MNLRYDTEDVEGGDLHKTEVLDDFFSYISRRNEAPGEIKVIGDWAETFFDIGSTYTSGEGNGRKKQIAPGRLRRIEYRQMGFVPYGELNNGDAKNFLAFSVGKFFPIQPPQEDNPDSQKFMNYSNFFSVIIDKDQFEKLNHISRDLPKENPFLFGTGTNPYKYVVETARGVRGVLYTDSLIKGVDNIEASTIICDGDGTLHHLPVNFMERRNLNLELGISEIKFPKYITFPRNIFPMHWKDVSRKSVDTSGGPKMYKGPIKDEGLGVRPASRQLDRLRF